MQGNNSGTQGGSQNNSPKQSGLSWSQPNSAKPISSIGSTATTQPKDRPMLKPVLPPATGGQGGGRKLLMLFVGGIVVGGLLAWSWFSFMSDSPVTENDTTPVAGGESDDNEVSGAGVGAGTGVLPGASIGSEALVVPSPQNAGLSVMVSSASVTSPTWVVVYESQNGLRGNALGAALFFPQGGAKTVNLLRATTAGRTYFVGRHVDNGDKQFSLTNDPAVVNAAGNPVYVEFRTR